jgi:putative tricarboxylic transport membrane protein
MAVGIFFAVGGIRLNPGTLHNPGPGFLPLVMALLLILFSLFILVRGLIKPMKPVSRFSWRRPALVVASVFFYGLLLDLVGFLISTFILTFILFGLLIKSKNRWPKVFLYAAATALVAWLIFSVALSVPFPPARLTTIWR